MFVNGGKGDSLKGVCPHQEAGSAGIAGEEGNLEGKALLKEMAVIPSAPPHHTHSVEFLDGVMNWALCVWEECFDSGTGGLYGFGILKQSGKRWKPW